MEVICFSTQALLTNARIDDRGVVVLELLSIAFTMLLMRGKLHKRVRSVNHKNNKSKSLKHNSNKPVNDCHIGKVIVNTNDQMSVIDSANVPISDNNKVSLNDNDMHCNSEYVLPSKRHTVKISVKHNSNDNDSVIIENKYDNLSVDDDEGEQGEIIPIKPPPPIMLKIIENFIKVLKKINGEWGPVKSKLGGPYIKLFTQSDEASHSLTTFLRTNDMGYFIIVSRSERAISSIGNNHRFLFEKRRIQLTSSVISDREHCDRISNSRQSETSGTTSQNASMILGNSWSTFLISSSVWRSSLALFKLGWFKESWAVTVGWVWLLAC
ncbi:hypothetical protein AVEN_90450-1 [Araneus ventricosus]|uniref:Uncharacterized protein n=1 Tax=Araneus ventricosus TaxID=182803 RepID=A0A4Y2TTF5_ARAVE|nr:hypothetical protein AVEN_90450-1 [Araneus ventricosus]